MYPHPKPPMRTIRSRPSKPRSPTCATVSCARSPKATISGSAPSGTLVDARAYGITAFARDVLTVADNLARTIEHVSAESRAAADPSLKALLDGVELTERDLQMILQKNGVKPISPSGRKGRSELPSGQCSKVPDSGPSARHGRAGGAAWLRHRRARASARDGGASPRAASKASPKSDPQAETGD